MRLEIGANHADLGLAALAAVVSEVRTHEDRIEDDALGCEQLEDEVMGAPEGLARQARRAETVLIGHHHEAVAGAPELDERGNHARHQPHFLEAVDLLVGGLAVEGAVAIQEQDARAAADAAACAAAHAPSRLSSRASFCARLPTEILSDVGSAGLARRSRTIVPPAMLARSRRPASRQSMRRKFASLGHTRSIRGNARSRPARYSRSSSSAPILIRVAASSAGSSAASAASMVGWASE